MLRALKDLFESLAPASAAGGAQDEHALQLATAVLLVEVMRAEPDVAQAERDAVHGALRRKFTLSADELERLMELAEDKARNANDFFAFTTTLNERFSQEQKVRIVEFMWQVAYADGGIDENENHVISKVAGLLHVTHGEYIAAKLHARQATGLGAP
ncbi:MAG TPA: TerB family tellurite resistance protein [Ramlibacter sp.]|nr:TerB family tellurite resistance protein [Ramlibacter sp.]